MAVFLLPQRREYDIFHAQKYMGTRKGHIMRKLASSLIAIALAAACAPATTSAEPGETTAVPTKAMGLILMDEDEYAALPERDPLMRGRLPQFVDLSPFFPTPGHQGDQGSCVGWAVGYALKTYQEAMELEIPQPQELDHFSPAFVFNSIKQGDDCTDGSLISDALEFVANTGAVRMEDFPYQEEQCFPPTEEIIASARDYSIKSYRRLQKDGMLFAIREAISNEKPVVIAMRVFPSFEDWEGGGNYKHDPDLEFQVDFHAVTVTGYDDDRRALKIINSWGTEWGDEGFFWMDYRAARDLIVEAYVTTDHLYEELQNEAPGLILAAPQETRALSVASSAPDVDEINEETPPPPPPPPAPAQVVPPTLTQSMLERAVTGHVGRTAEGTTPMGYDFYPASVWLRLEEPFLSQIESTEYYFYHPTFNNPKLPVEDSNVYLATWKGYGCIENAEVKVTLTTGEIITAPFNLCDIWDRFHPGAIRKDGSRDGSQPLTEKEDFMKKTESEPIEDKLMIKKDG